MFGVQQSNIRAVYKMMYGIITEGENNVMFWFGVISMVALPMIGIFDESRWGTLHGISAGIFFIGFLIYGTLLAKHLYANKEKFPAEEQAAIATIHTSVNTMFYITISFFISLLLFGSKGLTAILEWATVLYFVNFFSIASFTNPFYDSVH